MKIRILCNAQRQGLGYRKGDVVDWPEADAAAYIETQQAEPFVEEAEADKAKPKAKAKAKAE